MILNTKAHKKIKLTTMSNAKQLLQIIYIYLSKKSQEQKWIF